MSTTPRTDKARGFHDMDTAVSAEDMAQLENELAAAIQISVKYENRYFETIVELAAAKKRITDCEFVMAHRYKIIERQEQRCNEANARAEKAEARLEFLIVHGGDYVGYAETWNVSIEDLDADMKEDSK